jgi:hypothetical protein
MSWIARTLAVSLVVVAHSVDARADYTALPLFRPLEAPPTNAPVAAARITPFGPSPAPRIVLFPVMRVTRPSDIPPPKPTKGLGLVFDW